MGHALDKCSYNDCKRNSQIHHKDLPRPCDDAVNMCRPAYEIKPTKWREQQLIAAARDGNVALLDDALKEGADLETRNPMKMVSMSSDASKRRKRPKKDRLTEGLTPLMYAAHGGHLTCLMRLLEAQASVSAVEEDGMTALHFAATSGSLDVFKALVYAGADADQADDEGKHALEYTPQEIQSDRMQMKKWRAVVEGGAPEINATPDAL
mmetsp:Transcript_25607/g.59644  ORF Transcript_25607/g.59644 Transcript_25607/m.59644 type:complete len:209 (+) Transcript_25607:83-709(+)